VPAKAQRLLRRCLEKDPKRRLRDVGDSWQLLEDAAPPRAAASRVPWLIAAAAVLAFAIALWSPWRTTPNAATQPLTRIELDLGPDVPLSGSTGSAIALSPDGSRLVFVSKGRLYTRRLDQHQPALMPGTEGAYAPFFSPDGQWVGFFAGGLLKKTRIDGGQPIQVCNAPNGRGASWSEDGTIVATLQPQAGLSLIPPEGGRTTALTTLNPGNHSHRWPQFLPGGQAVLFTVTTDYGYFDGSAIAVVSLKDRRVKILRQHAGMYPRYQPGGFLTYVTNGMLFAAPFDPDRLEMREPVPLWEVSSNVNLGSAQLDFTRSGILAYRTGGAEGQRTFHWLDGEGTTTAIALPPANYMFPRLSPDGGHLAAMVGQGQNADIWVYDLERGGKQALTSGMQNGRMVWSVDGRYVVFESPGGMFWARADGAGKPQLLIPSRNIELPDAFTPDGAQLVFTEVTPDGGAEIRIAPIDSGSGQLRAGKPELFLKLPDSNTWSAVSPDGHWLAYSSAPAGQIEVYVRALPDNGTQVPISTSGGMGPRFFGNEILYRAEDMRIMAVRYSVRNGVFVPEKPRVWSPKELANTGLSPNFDVAQGSKRLLVVMPAESAAPRESQSRLTLVTNFLDEVRRRLAGGAK
jgi:serine/threonine-protein kinase